MGLLESLFIANPVAYVGVKYLRTNFDIDPLESIEQKAIDLTTAYINETLIAPLVVILNNTWDWLLVNILSPILMIVYIVLFFVAQYYLIKLYIWVGRNVLNKILSIIGYISQMRAVREIVQNLTRVLRS